MAAKKDVQAVLILQGGGALGAYQAGVYEALSMAKNHALANHDLSMDWVIGTSIGAINGAIIAGNRAHQRAEKLHQFWQALSQPALASSPWVALWSAFATPWMPGLHESLQASDTLQTMSQGIAGFFKPRLGALQSMSAQRPTHEAAFYDTSPLKATLEQVVDFEYLNHKSNPTRLTVCAVDVASGELTRFDSKAMRMRPEHIMASGALPPGFPAVEIEGRFYWDGGIYSNSPLDVCLGEQNNQDLLCFLVDVWDPTEALPTSIADAMTRHKDIQYASRAAEQLATYKKMEDLKRAIRILSTGLPKTLRDKPIIQEVMRQGADRTISVVHLIMKARAGDDYYKDVDFGAASIDARWQLGKGDALRALKHAAWLEPKPAHAGLVIHELPQQ